MIYQSLKQKAKIILNSKDAIKTETTATLNTVANTNITTNYHFDMKIPLILNEKAMLSVVSFRYKANVAVLSSQPTTDIGKVYIKNIPPRNVFDSEGYKNGVTLFPHYFSNSNGNNAIVYDDLKTNDLQLSSDTSWLNNGIDIFVSTMKKDDSGDDIKGCPSDDNWTLTLVIYDVQDFEYLKKELDDKVHNMSNPTRV